MGPELIAGGYTTKQSDLYQLGLLMYEMHTGQYPVDSSQGYDAMLQQIKEGVPRLKAEALGTPIGNIVSVLLRRNEQYRYTSPAQVWEELRRLDVWADVVRQTETLVPPPAAENKA
jgi:serine/threonine protein kinase